MFRPCYVLVKRFRLPFETYTRVQSASTTMKIIASLLFLFSSLAAAQFQFFEQFFQGGQQAQGQQEKQNVPSDSSWYRQNWEGGE